MDDSTVPLRNRLHGEVTPPCSKSYAQRALAAALLAKGRTTLRGIELCRDTRSAIEAIEALGAKVEILDDNTLIIDGGLCPATNNLNVGESGLAARLFTPIAALCDSPITINGAGTLLHRPMAMMIEPLKALGVNVRDGGGRLPIEVCGPMNGGEVAVDGSVSSQFITGLLIALPLATNDTTINVHEAVSTPYIDMTLKTLERFGINVMYNEGDYTQFYIEGGQEYQAIDYTIESDWSAAAAIMVAAAIAGEVTIRNISTLSSQADTAICRALERAGASIIIERDTITIAHRTLEAFEFDATQCPDLFPALTALAAAADGVSSIYGIGRLRGKESDRAEVLCEEYGKLGIEIELDYDNDVMRIVGGEPTPHDVDSHDDHRIAMSLAITALRMEEPINIKNRESVAKSYPSFFEDIESLKQHDGE
ncbi:MAG: 3-phosphoshikimate 1-carboxyvinyltransferase [Rikenellaceae bacterium]|nr:3-phosphoshikimate 1-carboxyvinyltransferase [Rikenellaceae bacterium]